LLNPVILPIERLAVQEKVVPATLEVNRIFVVFPEHMVSDIGLFVR
jgi:hypothetical protein